MYKVTNKTVDKIKALFILNLVILFTDSIEIYCIIRNKLKKLLILQFESHILSSSKAATAA